MSSLVNIDGVAREATPYININGVMRESSSYVNVNGVLREVISNHQRLVTADDIKYFDISFIRDKNPYHPKYPHLGYNPNLRGLKLTGDIIEEISQVSFNHKGVELMYDRYPENPNEEEGIVLYNAHIYAVLMDDTPIDICCLSQTDEDSSLNTGNKITDLKINIQATLIYESNGYYMTGWNNICNTKQFISSEIEPLKPNSKNFKYVNNYPLLPVSSRLDDYQPLMQIGYVMDLHNDGDNMVGSHGVLDQSIHWITVNGNYKPFVIEVHD